MYCSTCGAESSAGLNYCNRCGASKAPATELVPISLAKPAFVIGAIVTVLTLGGFGILIEGAVHLAAVFHVPDPILAILVLGIATIIACDLLLLRLLSRIVRASLDGVKPQPAKPAMQQNDGVPRQLNPQFDSVASVTENTTRTFSPVFTELDDRGTK